MTDFANLVIKADSTQVKGATKDLQGMGSAAGALTGAMKALLPALTAVLSVRALGKMAAEAREFGAAVGEVSTLLNDLDQLPRIEREAKALAATFGGSPTAQVNAFYQAISAGASDAEEATQILTTANKLAVGGVTDVGTAIDGLTTIVNSFGLEASQSNEVSDAMFVAMKAGKTTIEELSSSVGRAAALAATAGVSYEELLGATAALTAGGIKTSEAVNGIKATLSNVLKPSEDAKKAAEEMGIQFDLAALQSQGLQGFMEGVTEAADGNQQKLVSLFGSVEALNTVLALTGGSAESFEQIMSDMTRRTGETDIAFGKIAETMDFKLELIQGKLASTRVVVGEFLLGLAEPIVDNLVENFDAYVLFLSNLVSGMSQTMDAIILAIAPMREAFMLAFQTMSGWIQQFVGFGSEMFEQLGISGLKVSEIIGIAFNEVFGGLKAGIQTNTIEVASFVDKTVAKVRGFVDSSYDAETRLAAIDMARTRSLQAVSEELRANTAKYADQLIQVRLNETGFTLLDPTVQSNVENTGDLSANLQALAASMGTSTTETACLNDAAEELNETLTEGTGIQGENTNVLDEGTESLDLQKTMLENLQTEWGNLIYNFLDEGKLRFKDFFRSVVDGFKRMVAELAAQDLMKAVFGGGGLGALTNGGLTGMLSKGVSSVAGLFGGGGGAAAASGGAAAAAGGAGAAAAGAGAAGAGGLMSGIGSLVSSIPGWGWALGGAAILANVLDSGGTMSGNAGMLTQDLGHDGTFAIDPFSSGAQFTGFARRSGQGDAMGNIDAFRQLDDFLTQAYVSVVGSAPHLNASDFVGYDENGSGRGAFFGAASEDGSGRGADLETQLGKYASRWIELAGAQAGISGDAIRTLIGGGSAAGIMQRVGGIADGSHANGIDRVPFNGYRAVLHEGERVQTKQEVLATSSGTTDNGGMIYQALLSILNHIIKTFDIIDRWNNNGIPEERTAP